MPESTTHLSEAESALERPTPWLKQHITKEVVGSLPPSGMAEAKINIFATIEVAGTTHEVVKLPDWQLSDLYMYSMAPVIEFANSIGTLVHLVRSIGTFPENSVDWEMHSARLFNTMKQLGKFMGISAAHDELIVLLQTISVAEGPLPLTRAKLDALHAVLASLESRINLDDALIDRVTEDIEAAGFDVNYPMALASDSQDCPSE